ncbi:hypothetical protein HDF16_002792 [Granulicella aggregans]|uniref:Uncharacterized protein n=1 Tax=Granulicella aggregans TaxID=474949 RepID=A0A7W7ZDU5_9BACT|nr:hypothetical protein [Granulicella aggregans]MBB5058086.1 hypothetical protein [Granulicella aggregans]
MSDLLNLAIEAHGGLKAWNKLHSIRIVASITGTLWSDKGQEDVLKEVVMTAETKRERLITDFPTQGKRSIFEPNRIVFETFDGKILETRDDPRGSLANHNRVTPWDDFDVACFSSEALWTDLTVPFLYSYDGFVTREIASVEEEGETWRRLWVTFPEGVTSHTRDQVSCFGPDGLLRRQDYSVDLLKGATWLNFASRYRQVQGIVVPTKRRVYASDGDYRIVPAAPLLAVDMIEVTAY